MIQLLDKNVSNKIAAGEVVDRPLSIVKELLENSIDAGADSIVVEIKQGGKKYIRVTDNGSGINSVEIELAFTRHATSKIRSAEDLSSIDTLGFRGEALSSIAAVSMIEVITKTKDSLTGAKVNIKDGNLIGIESVGCGDGTSIIVKDLFYNTPARLKFMKADGSESTPIIEFVSQMALAYPNIKFRLISNEKMIFSSTGTGDRIQTIALLYGKEVADNLLPIKHCDDYLKIEGFISNLNISKPSRRKQVYFVNGRVVDNKIIQNAIFKAYEDKLIVGRYPVAFIFLQVPAEEIDVNIHPNKLEIKFQKEEVVLDFLIYSINMVLNTMEAAPTVVVDSFKSSAINLPSETKIKKEEQTSIRDFLAKARAVANNQGASQIKESSTINKNDYNTKPEHLQKEEVIIKDLIIIGSIFATYILAKDEDCIYFIDQHAAHERVFYEELMKKYGKDELAEQSLLTPFVVDFPRILMTLASQIKDDLKKLGFVAEEFGNNSYIIKSIPAFLSLKEAEIFVGEYLDSVTPGVDYQNQGDKDRIIMKSCKSAVKAKDALTPEEMRALLLSLDKCDNPYNCPHGRPVFIKLSHYDIERMFKRV